MKIIPTIEKYVNGITSDDFHRYKSWDSCHQVFDTTKQTDIHTLELAFYLASWGMYRGSSGLLQKNHQIHKGAVDILFSQDAVKLKCNSDKDVDKKNIADILKLKTRLADHYRNILFTKGADDPKPISPTDTLLSKIMLGTFGCVPAYDRYFIDGLKEMDMTYTVFNDPSLNELFDFIQTNKKDIEKSQKIIKEKTGRHYPLMKILDMYFWQIGYDKDVKNKKQKKKQ